MFNVGTPELLVILLVALIVLGPNKLPDAARQVGRFMGEFRRMSSGFQNELRDAMQEPMSSVKETLKGDPVPKATPASAIKPVSKVIDQSIPDESAAADPSSTSLGGPAPDTTAADDHAGSDDEASSSSASEDPPDDGRTDPADHDRTPAPTD